MCKALWPASDVSLRREGTRGPGSAHGPAPLPGHACDLHGLLHVPCTRPEGVRTRRGVGLSRGVVTEPTGGRGAGGRGVLPG